MPSKTPVRKTGRKSSRSDLRSWLGTIALVAVVVLIGAIAGLVLGAVVNVPNWSPEKLYGSETTTLYDRDMKPFAYLHAEENRVMVPLSKIPPDLIHAFVATEDQQFYEHHGVNPVRIIKALIIDMTTGAKVQGASTITQQLARNAFLNPEKTWERKIKEAVLAIQLESQYSKDEIMQFYLNKINFGSGAWGVQTAAQTYFGKDVDQLNLAECALLAGLVKAPNYYSPFRNPDKAKQRQRIVLNNMVHCGYITQEQADEAYRQPLKYAPKPQSQYQFGHFTDYVIEEADRILSEEGLYENPQDAIFKGGLKIYTTMDRDIQQYAEKIYSDPSYFPPLKDENGNPVQSAMVILDHKTGEIVALVGGRNYNQQRSFNRAVDALRQPGSSFKPLVVYGPALEMGYSPDYVLEDAPVTFNFGGTTWSPKNYDGKYLGPINMRTAVAKSVNIYAVKLADEIGIRNGIEFAKRCGITTLVEAGRANDMNLSTALGGITKGVSPLEMASAYGCFANQGIRAEHYVISKIEDRDGNTIYEFQPKYERVMKKETAWQMSSLLQGVVEFGTGKAAKIAGVKCAGKTGTTQDDKDAWFVGYTPYYTCAVWMGFDKEKTMSRIYGGSYPARIWKAIMSKAVAGKKSGSDFGPPDDVVAVKICTKSGKLASPACPEEDVQTKYLPKDQVPKETCDLHYLVDICTDSGKLATEYCPNRISKGYLKGALPGDPEAAPQEYCDIHTAPTQSFYNDWDQVKVYVCTDPRHNGQIYLANIPKPGETGGCPSQYIREMVVKNPQNLPKCNLPDHQIGTP